MNEIETGYLHACSEYVRRQQEMLPLLAREVGVEQHRVFYEWGLRRCGQSGTLADSDWNYFFHGLECDLRNRRDKRFLRMDFGPGGRVGFLDAHGVVRLVMTSVLPWREFPELRTYFVKEGHPFGEYSIALEKVLPVWTRLDSQGFFEQAAPELVALQAKSTMKGPDQLNHARFPPDVPQETLLDWSVAHRIQLSQKAILFLRSSDDTSRGGAPLQHGKYRDGTPSTEADFDDAQWRDEKAAPAK